MIVRGEVAQLVEHTAENRGVGRIVDRNAVAEIHDDAAYGAVGAEIGVVRRRPQRRLQGSQQLRRLPKRRLLLKRRPMP